MAVETLTIYKPCTKRKQRLDYLFSMFFQTIYNSKRVYNLIVKTANHMVPHYFRHLRKISP